MVFPWNLSLDLSLALAAFLTAVAVPDTVYH